MEAIPPKPVFDSMLRKIIVENAANDAFTPARALSLTRERLARTYQWTAAIRSSRNSRLK